MDNVMIDVSIIILAKKSLNLLSTKLAAYIYMISRNSILLTRDAYSRLVVVFVT